MTVLEWGGTIVAALGFSFGYVALIRWLVDHNPKG